jgi:hypothetical protein
MVVWKIIARRKMISTKRRMIDWKVDGDWGSCKKADGD